MVVKALKVASLGFRRWGANVRYPLLAIMLFIFLWWFLEPLKVMAQGTGYATNPFVLPFVLGSEGKQLIFMFGALFLFANAPFSDEAQLFVLFRTGRRTWVLGQVFYIVGSAMVYVAVILVFSLIILAPVSMLSFDDWGKVVSTLCYTDASSVVHLGFPVPEKILVSLTPLSALGLQYALEVIVVTILGLVLFAVNLLSPLKVGLFAGGALAAFDLIIINVLPFDFYHFSPVSLARLTLLDFNGASPYLPDIDWAFGFDLCVVLVLTIFVLIVSKKISIETTPDL